MKEYTNSPNPSRSFKISTNLELLERSREISREFNRLAKKTVGFVQVLIKAPFSAHMTFTCFTADSEKGLVPRSRKRGMCFPCSAALNFAPNFLLPADGLYIISAKIIWTLQNFAQTP
jgi:hypothetical protein